MRSSGARKQSPCPALLPSSLIFHVHMRARKLNPCPALLPSSFLFHVHMTVFVPRCPDSVVMAGFGRQLYWAARYNIWLIMIIDAERRSLFFSFLFLDSCGCVSLHLCISFAHFLQTFGHLSRHRYAGHSQFLHICAPDTPRHDVNDQCTNLLAMQQQQA